MVFAEEDGDEGDAAWGAGPAEGEVRVGEDLGGQDAGSLGRFGIVGAQDDEVGDESFGKDREEVDCERGNADRVVG